MLSKRSRGSSRTSSSAGIIDAPRDGPDVELAAGRAHERGPNLDAFRLHVAGHLLRTERLKPFNVALRREHDEGDDPRSANVVRLCGDDGFRDFSGGVQ